MGIHVTCRNASFKLKWTNSLNLYSCCSCNWNQVSSWNSVLFLSVLLNYAIGFIPWTVWCVLSAFRRNQNSSLQVVQTSHWQYFHFKYYFEKKWQCINDSRTLSLTLGNTISATAASVWRTSAWDSFLHWLSSLMGVIINMHTLQVIHRNTNLGNLSLN